MEKRFSHQFFVALAIVFVAFLAYSYGNQVTGKEVVERVYETKVNEKQESSFVQGMIGSYYIDDPKKPIKEYTFITSDGAEFDLNPEKVKTLVSREREDRVITLRRSEIKNFVSKEQSKKNNILSGYAVAGPMLNLRDVFPSPPSKFGRQNTIVILTDHTGSTLLYPPSVVENIVFNDTNKFIEENSGGLTWLKGHVTGWYNTSLANTTRGSFSACTNQQIGIQLADPFVNFTEYDAIILIGPCEYAPYATVGPIPLNTSEGLVSVRLINLPKSFLFDYQPTAIVSHEFGHGLGIDSHANAYSSCTPPFSIAGPLSCIFLEYGDPFDTMGGAFNSEKSSPHFSAYHKNVVGWIREKKTVHVGETIFVKPLEVAKVVTLLELPYRSVFDYMKDPRYTIEYRIVRGFEAIRENNWPPVEQGIYLHYNYFTVNPRTGMRSRDQRLVDAHPQTQTLNDSFLQGGENYTDFLNNITISVINTSEAGAWVNIRRR